MTPRDELELNVLERTGDVDIAEYIGSVMQWAVEHEAERLSFMMGVSAELLMPDLWEMVEVKMW